MPRTRKTLTQIELCSRQFARHKDPKERDGHNRIERDRKCWKGEGEGETTMKDTTES